MTDDESTPDRPPSPQLGQSVPVPPRPRRDPPHEPWSPTAGGLDHHPTPARSADTEPTVEIPVVDRHDQPGHPARSTSRGGDGPSLSGPSLSGPRPTGAPARVRLSDDDYDYDSVESRPYLRRLEEPPRPGPDWATVLKVGAFLVLIVAGIGFVARLRFGGAEDATGADSRGGPVVDPTVDELARATAQIVGLGRNGEPICSGSGTFVSTDGMILTNAHVVTPDTVCDFASLGVAVTADAGRPPELRYRAELLAIDNELDLAVVQVTGAIDPDEPVPDTFPALALGDSDTLAIGDDVRILGYPEIGGETITFTNGSVSGFTAQAGIGDRALIKTDATIAGGNSGGAAVDVDGRLIGIPTKARASESGPAVDCRPLVDTNGDGELDDADNCVPIGGFLNGIRPVNLARNLIAAARQALPRPLEGAGPRVEVDPGAVTMSRPRFSVGETDNRPAEVVTTATSGINELCLFVDWDGIPDGVEWDGIWWYEDDIVAEYSLVEQSWEFGPEGTNFWMCAIDDENGLDAGLYELGFFLDGQLIFAEGIVLADEPVPVLATTWVNESGIAVCGLAINPQGSGQVGLDELAPGEVIPPDGTTTIDLPVGEVVVEAYDCGGEPMADSAGALLIEPDRTYTIGGPGAGDG